MVDPQTGHVLPQIAQTVESRARVEAVRSAGRVDPFVDGHVEVVFLAQMLDESGVDRDLVVEHDLVVLDSGPTRHQRDVAHDDGGVELELRVLLRPRSESERQVGGADAAFVVELFCLRPDGFRTPTRVREDVVVADEAGESGGATGQQLCQAGGVGAGEVDAAVTGVPEMKHGVATAQMGSLLLPLGEDISEFWELFVSNGIRHNSTLTRICP